MSVTMNAAAAKAEEGQGSLPFWPVLLTLFCGSFVGMYPMVSLNVSLPGFIGIFHSGLGTVQWIITGFTLAFGMIAPVSGYLSNRFGGKRMFLLSLAGITVSSVMCSLSWNIQALIFFRILQGVWCGLIQPVSLAMIYQTLPRGRQPLAVSVWSFSTVLGMAVGPSVSGWLPAARLAPDFPRDAAGRHSGQVGGPYPAPEGRSGSAKAS
ncbi:MFS transporter [Paenibacillus sp. JTLBN-2024]